MHISRSRHLCTCAAKRHASVLNKEGGTGSRAKGICMDCSTLSHSFNTSSSVPPGFLRTRDQRNDAGITKASKNGSAGMAQTREPHQAMDNEQLANKLEFGHG